MITDRVGRVAQLLDWHQRRRCQGVATISVLVGQGGVAEREWRYWASRSGRQTVVVRTTDSQEITRIWLRTASTSADLIALARTWIADRGIVLPTRYTQHDLDRMGNASVHGSKSPDADIAYTILATAGIDSAVDTELIIDQLIPEEDNRESSIDRLFAGMVGLSPASPWPTLLMTADGDNYAADRLELLERLATSIPVLPIGMIIDPDIYGIEKGRSGSTRRGVLLQEGLIEVESVALETLTERLRTEGVIPPPSAMTLARLTADGLAPDIADAYVDAIHRVRANDPDDAAEDFRSVHERFLFEQLEAIPATAALFRPNRPLPFRHGSHAAVADLLAESLKIVVEVDGRHYHLTDEQFRRDRRKDWLYQRHGYLVLRFLAEDVVEDLESIVTTILEAIELRRSG